MANTFTSSTEKENPVKDKSYSFALKTVTFCKSLIENKKEFVLSKQYMKSGTSVGANIEEASQAQSRNDFVSKMSIALKEAYESRYWIRLIRDSGYATKEETEGLITEITEIICLLVVIIKTAKQNAAA